MSENQFVIKKYNSHKEQIILEKYKGTESEVIIPDGVTEIAIGVFENCTSLTKVVLPDSIRQIGFRAFKNCTSLMEVVLPNSNITIFSNAFANCPKLQNENGLAIINDVLYGYYGSAAEVTIPEGVLKIDDKVFQNNLDLKKVVIPDTVTEIGEHVFDGCSNLESAVIPASVKRIDWDAFRGCSELKDIGEPTGLEDLKYGGGFEDCSKLADSDGFIIVNGFLIRYVGDQKEATVPANVVTICNDAFFFNNTLISITIPENVKVIGSSAFPCRSLKTFRMNGPVDMDETHNLTNCTLDIRTFSASEKIWFYLNLSRIKAVKEIKEWIIRDFDANIRLMMELLDQWNDEKKDLRMAKLMVENKDKIFENTKQMIQDYFTRHDSKAAIRLLAKNNIIAGNEKTAAQKRKQEAKEAAQMEIDAEKLRKHERPDEKEVENYVSELNKRIPYRSDLNFTSKKPVYYRNSGIPVRDSVLKMIFTIYSNMFDRISYSQVGDFGGMHSELYTVDNMATVSREADHIYSYIDPDSFDVLLKQLVNSKDYRMYVLAFGRFATNEYVEDAVEMIKRRKKGTARERYWASNVEQSLTLSETQAAIKYYDSIRRLDYYAEKWHTTPQEIRDSVTMTDFGFDENGVKKYQCGTVDLDVTVGPDLKLVIYDNNAGKQLKSFPSKAKDTDQEELNELKEDYKTLGKEVKKFIKTRVQNLKQMHIDGTAVKKESWINVYTKHPVIKHLSEKIVWTDGNQYFIPTPEGITDVDGNIYDPGEKIKVANVLDMDKEQIGKWQKYIIEHGIKQPFEQMWEPVFDLEKYKDSKAFAGMTLTSSERNAMKKNLKEKGIDVYSDEIASGYNHRAGQYYFDDRNKMHFGTYADADYKINDDKSIVFEKITFRAGANKNAVNTILLALHRQLIEHSIAEDNDEMLNKDELDAFTLAQILSFVNTAEEHESVKCKAVLMDYRNEKYPEYNALDDLILEL